MPLGPVAALAAYRADPPTAIVRVPTGLIHETYFVDYPDERLVLQRMHPIFAAAVLEDTLAVTEELARQGWTTPRLRRSRGGALGVADDDGRLWRVLGFVAGVTVDRVDGPARAHEAGRLVGAFHRALAGFGHEFRHVRAGVHDTAAHLARLQTAAAAAPGDDRHPLAAAILDEARRLPQVPPAPPRVAHGDLKISNLLFAAGEPPRALCLLDLDTLGRLPLAHELGDAWRSWCNPAGEDAAAAALDLELFAAACGGYAATAGALLEDAEVAGLVPGVQTIALELAARFQADAFEDRYFGWDKERFPSRRAHNQARAAGQLALSRSVAARRAAAEAIIARAFRRL